ncbi:MAG TPA: hypothetical protein VFH10_18075 [Nocardioides sp.]|uniref:DUF7144 family membrane protein n=1 Tax=Nocardioides sp. TaxID=35761 RepID=UPI002D7E16CD|nr:hypothetical protein [Nocardioides sp.]HET6654551.1 hypothetical protein [Nocardioides sp.]
MTQFAGQQPIPPSPTSPDYVPPSAWVGWTAFAGVLMVMIGTFHAFQGLVALFKDEYFLVGKEELVVTIDYTGWGWTHIIVGLIVVAAGFGVFAGKIWARTIGVILAGLSAVVNMAFLSAYPIWSILMIALDVVVIMALTVHGSEIKAGA